MRNYNDLESLLTPRVEAKASDKLRASVNAIEPGRRRRWWQWSAVASVAAAAVVCGFVFITPAHAEDSVAQLIRDAVAQLGENFTIVMEARTEPKENFEFYDAQLAPVPVTMSVNGREWRIDKGGRVACGNDSVTYMWIDGQIGYRSVRRVAMIESFGRLLSPKLLLESVLAEQGSSVKVMEEGDEIRLTITNESSLVFLCAFDAATHKLLDYHILTEAKGKTVTLLRTKSIVYGEAVVDMSVPAGIQWVDVDNARGISGEMSPEEAAREVLSAFERWDASVLEPAFSYYNYEQLKGEYGGAKLVKIGKAFTKRGFGDHQFVPYILTLRNGVKKEYSISLIRADDGTWLVDGGI